MSLTTHGASLEKTSMDREGHILASHAHLTRTEGVSFGE
jgi:hypothetical protein